MTDSRLSRRMLLAGAGGAAIAAPVLAQKLIDLHLPGGPSLRPLEPAFPGKGEVIVQRVRPPLLETPMSVFREGTITPNDRFFVRWNWDLPTEVKAADHRVAVGGAVKQAVSLTLDEVAAAGEHVDVVAINQCAGNGRGLSEPRVTGTQWGNGAMGCAKWTGVRLRDVLAKAGGTAPWAKRVRFAGLDVPLTDGAPQFIKSIPMDIAMRDDVLVAWGMNDEPLSLLHGFPLRIVVPGWFSTYWVKMLSTIEVLSDEEDPAHYMADTYRFPAAPVKPGDKDFPTVPITTMPPRAFITSHADGEAVARGEPLTLKGIAMGGDAALAKVDLVGAGLELPCELGPDEGPYAFRRWQVTIPAVTQDLAGIGVRAANAKGAVQPEVLVWNPSGYARNVIERITLRAL
ncbi:molybdopterin-dependent oxidoreductase [Porphyrobacter sp. LM 6]|uniref:molybdopterin-dependent oxidoreductase n=1 Tax=Porphyrobacter sp. LM 6 TaxID=1896196 RepID=UPI000846ABDA|nr:molybdopterin-dependent oxidoreductase [Porphyrobacter sp. LM 6]AOL94094.1 DMSO/TMAO reductase YedYZ, molybdopterin-dependent catalytic subunit [Porphyrobacter sp. LM 6]